MSQQPILFQPLSRESKVEFFANCQRLLINFHPDSEFLFTTDNYAERKLFVLDFLHKYKGYCYSDDNICVLFNKVKVEDPRNPIKVIKDHIYKEPAEDFNAYSIDFVVFRKLSDCMNFCQAQYSPRIEYVLFVKNNEVKLYETSKLLAHLNGPLGRLAMFGNA
jgi:hypothetical protein